MEVINTVVGKMVEVLTEHFLTSMGRRIGYVVHYKKNIEELNDKVQNLKGLRGRIEGKVDIATNNGEVIENDVLNWLTNVNKREEDFDKLWVDRENIKSCFHVRSRYRLGKKGKKLLSDVSGLIEGGDKFDRVGHPAPLIDIWYTFTTGFESFESRELVRKQIIEVLKDDKNYKIGIHGMTGTGKTRMVEEIAKQAQTEKLFDEVAKVVFSQNPNLKKIQTELAVCLNLSFRTEIEVGRKGELLHRLKNGKKILVIIDDIWSDEIKLEEIGIPSSDNHIKGCKVLMTSREENVFIQMGVQENFLIGLLQEHEAWYLFRKTVGDFIEYTNEINSVAKQVCRECDRLPLAILVVGASLRNQKEKHTWDDALGQLKNCRGDNIKGVAKELYSRVEWSYKYLKLRDACQCFLHCSLFPEDAEIPIDDLVMYGVGTRFLMDSSHTMKAARDRTLVLVDTLKNSHLLLEGKSKDFVKMHDVIRDVAIGIASKEGFMAKTGVPKWPEKDEYDPFKVKVISLRSKNICELPLQLDYPNLRTLVLECDADRRPQVSDSFFNRTEMVEVLDLCHVWLPSSLLNLINLRMLRLCNCGQVNLAFLKELRKLEILSIVDSDLKEVAIEVGQMTSLRWLDLSRCTKLEIIPSGVINNLSNIEELYIPHNFGGWGDERNAGLDELNSLTRLTTLQIHIEDGLVLPNELCCFELLNRFKISIGRSRGFWVFEENLGVTMLKLDNITLRNELINILMEKTEVLFLKRVDGLKNVLHCGDGKGFLNLKYLKIEHCSDMEYRLGRPNWNLQTQGSFSKLSELKVRNCMLKFLFLPSMARAFLQLQRLSIMNCEIMKEIILDDEEVMDRVIFCQLKKMKLHYLPILRSICSNKKKTSTTECSTSTDAQALFNEKVSFPALEKLDIEELNSVTTIWDNQLLVSPETEEESFRRLRHLMICGCKKLENVIPSNLIPRLQNLETLQVKLCDLVVSAVEVLTIEKGSATTAPTIELPRLQQMTLRSLPKLMLMGLNRKEHSDHRLTGAYSNLTYLYIERCHSLRNVFSSSIARNLRQLQYLSVTNCEKIEEIIAIESGQREEEVTKDDEIIVFPQLKNIKLQRLPGLKSFWFGSKKTAVEPQVQVKALFNHKVKFPSLEEFEYSWNKSNLKEIWSSTVPIDAVCKLRKLTVGGCDKLLSIAPPSKLLQNLEVLYIYKCPNLEKGLETTGVEKLSTSFQLTSLTIDRCHSLRNVFSPSIARNLQQLQELRVSDCEKIEEIIAVETVQGREEVTDDEIIVFPRLKNMTFDELPNLKSFWSCTYGSNKEAMKDDIPQVHALFNYKVKFPFLEEFFCMESKNNLKEIWNTTVPTNSFCKLRKLTVSGCEKLLSVAPSKLLGSFRNLEELEITYCSSLKEIFKFEGSSNNAEQGIVVARDKAIEEDSETISEFPSLLTMGITSCPKLKSAAFYASKKKVVIEEVIRNEDEGEEDGVMDEIVFPKLQSMHLGYLANLTSFCGANNAFKLPSLIEVVLRECPKIQTFTSGRISTQLIQLTEDYSGIHKKVSDLNKYVEQCVEKRKGSDDEETSLANDLHQVSDLNKYIQQGVRKRKGSDDEETSLANNLHQVSDLNKYVQQGVRKRKGSDDEETSLANDLHQVSDLNKYVKQGVRKRKGSDDEETSLANDLHQVSDLNKYVKQGVRKRKGSDDAFPKSIHPLVFNSWSDDAFPKSIPPLVFNSGSDDAFPKSSHPKRRMMSAKKKKKKYKNRRM